MNQTELRDNLADISVIVGSKRIALLSQKDLASEPIKWLKYVLLDSVGLESLSEISAQIHRFRLSSISDSETWVRDRFKQNTNDLIDLMVVVKIVPRNKGAQLRNYRIFGITDVTKVFSEIRSTADSRANEIWCCESSVRKDGFNLAGRLSFPVDSTNQVIEVVWFGSPRLLETVRIPEFALPYARASREKGDQPLKIDVLHVPEKYQQSAISWADDLWWIAREFQTRHRSVKMLTDALRSLGAAEVCLTFKISDGQLTIIDWDTQVESTR